MEGSLTVAAQLSSLFTPYQATTIVLPTRQGDAPLPPSTTNSDSPAEHASLSNFFHSPLTGTILIRLIHSGLILELISLTHDVPPIRIIFPAIVLPLPSIMVWEDQELHIIALTQGGSLFRVILPIRDGLAVWKNATTPGNYWYREYIVSKLKPPTPGMLAQVQSAHSVAIGLYDGSLLRLETREMGHESEDDQWEEIIYSHTSLFTSLTSFLHTNVSIGSEIISMATLPQPTDIGDVWTLSRDRTLRMWTVSGCISAKMLTIRPTGRTVSPALNSSTNIAVPAALLQKHPQRLLRAFIPAWSNGPHLLAFVPTESSSTTAGVFQLFSAMRDQLQVVAVVECSPNSVHCHLQDFVVAGDTLCSLWDRGGQSVVEVCVLSSQPDNNPVWQIATYPEEAELTPAYLDELLLSPGSLTDRYFEAIMRPGMFSPLTLQVALEQYVDACLSLPGASYSRPPQLLATYTSLAESIAAVVGCTVQLGKDPHTGTQQYDKYWNSLKRDWEGFIARCREIERSARWPLTIGFGDPKGSLLIAERERVGVITAEDLPLQLYRLLSVVHPVQSRYEFLEILWAIRTRMGRRAMLSLESRLIDIVHQEIAFPYADIIQDQAQRSDVFNELDEGLANWITGRLQSVQDIDTATRLVLDVIGGCDQAVKREEEEVELLLPPPVLEWTRSLTAAYVMNSVQARYDLCLCLIALLFFLSEDLQQWDPSLLAEIFVVFRGVAMLRHTSRQPAGHQQVSDDGGDDDVVVKMRNMNVSTARSSYRPTYSLLHQLLARSSSGATLPYSAHHFLDTSGLLQSVSPAHATRSEVQFCESLRALGYREATRDALAWLPRTPGASYVQSRLWIDEGRYEDAASILESLSGSFSEGRNGLSEEDADALASVLPGYELFDSEFSFYLHAAMLFKECSVTSYEVSFTQLAISVAPVMNTMQLWSIVMKGLIDLGLYNDAYGALMSSPYEKLKRECIPPLVYRMCEEHAVDRLISFNFHGLDDDVEECLSFKARNADPRVRPFFSRILYTWYISRCEYRNASLTMYQRAKKLNSLRGDPTEFLALAELQMEAYAVSINALSLVDQKNAWFVISFTDEGAREGRKRQKLSKFIPENKFSEDKREVEIVTLSDIKHEYALLRAQIKLVQLKQQFLSINEVLSQPSSVILKLAQLGHFETALAAGRALDIDMTDIFAHLTNQCLRLSRNPDTSMVECTSDWLLTDRVSSWAGTWADRAWRYLRQSLEQHDGPQSDYAYSKVTLETILAFERSSPPPPWLIQILADHHPEYLIRACLRYDVLDYALEYTLDLMTKSDTQFIGHSTSVPSATWLPYTLIDQVVVAAETQTDLSVHGQKLRNQLRLELSNHLKRMQKLSVLPR